MTEAQTAAPAGLGLTAGAMLREARERQGMHIAMLAAMMKVTPRKLEALESDRYEELPDLAFVRALAQSVCRTLKVDPEPVLAKLPMLAKPAGLEHAAQGLNTPFRERGAGHGDPEKLKFLKKPVFWATALVLGAAAAVAFAPRSWLPLGGRLPFGGGAASSPTGITSEPVRVNTAPAPIAPGVVSEPVASPAAPVVAVAPQGVLPPKAPDLIGPPRPEADPPVLTETVHAAPPVGAPSATVDAQPAVGGALVVRAKAEAWVEVVDGRGRPLIGRTLQAGETVGIDGDVPFRVRLGNVGGTDLQFRGSAVDLARRAAGNNTARFELK